VTYKSGKDTYKVRVKFDMLQKPFHMLQKPGSKPRSSNLANAKTIGNKMLTPDGLKLAGKIIPRSSFVKEVEKAIQANTTVAPHVKDFMVEILRNSSKTTAAFPKAKLSNKDIAIDRKRFWRNYRCMVVLK